MTAKGIIALSMGMSSAKDESTGRTQVATFFLLANTCLWGKLDPCKRRQLVLDQKLGFLFPSSSYHYYYKMGRIVQVLAASLAVLGTSTASAVLDLKPKSADRNQ